MHIRCLSFVFTFLFSFYYFVLIILMWSANSFVSISSICFILYRTRLVSIWWRRKRIGRKFLFMFLNKQKKCYSTREIFAKFHNTSEMMREWHIDCRLVFEQILRRKYSKVVVTKESENNYYSNFWWLTLSRIFCSFFEDLKIGSKLVYYWSKMHWFLLFSSFLNEITNSNK